MLPCSSIFEVSTVSVFIPKFSAAMVFADASSMNRHSDGVASMAFSISLYICGLGFARCISWDKNTLLKYKLRSGLCVGKELL